MQGLGGLMDSKLKGYEFKTHTGLGFFYHVHHEGHWIAKKWLVRLMLYRHLL